MELIAGYYCHCVQVWDLKDHRGTIVTMNAFITGPCNSKTFGYCEYFRYVILSKSQAR